MTETSICPYTGLRSFTEEESLYFKGRDEQIDQVTALLEQNKFLMVTGASGEGKSSLIYAGLIPNARAGFFKASYTNWVVADFRPERSPVKNMADALARGFQHDSSTIETEIRRGFSSLVDLYTNSQYYIDEKTSDWNELTEEDRRLKKRGGANLLILVDQFEEFFTNPENFFGEAPSQDSQIVVNLIIETARLALKRRLPIYVVCTMRSDYIGQCSAFRGLAEYIGFSQFFVPRLKRKDLKQVIEEPAILSGNSITQRLVERLVYDIAEGVDQLPILQHALSQIWLAADHGREEMDLIHYAMVGGMPSDDLPDDDVDRFNEWLQTLSANKRKYFSETGLSKVIEIHANVLYENAWEYYNQSHESNPITQREAKRIVALTFSCLTKIDNSRAVRNRMSLEEISNIVNTPGFTAERVGEVINIYREEGNSFIRPFKTEESETHKLSPETVLDITHESLIRNWDRLNRWASQEFEYYSNYLDFKKQMDRWKANGKSGNFLLPIGPLTFFENWYKECAPNVGWIRRYSEIHDDEAKASAEAKEILADIREFLKRSARKVLVTRAFMKYGPQRIATIAAIIILLILSGFYWYDAEQKEEQRVLKAVRARADGLLQSTEVSDGTKSIYLLAQERLIPGTMIRHLQGMPIRNRVSLANEIYRSILYVDKKFSGRSKVELVQLMDQSLSELKFEDDQVFYLTEYNKFMQALVYDEYYNPGKELTGILGSRSAAYEQYIKACFSSKEFYKSTLSMELNLAIQTWLTFGNPKKSSIVEVLELMSPFDSEKAREMFEIYYAKGTREPNGVGSHDFGGGYHTLACLYAAVGSVDNVIRTFQTMKETGQMDYFNIPRHFNNHINVMGYFYLFGNRSNVMTLMKWIEANSSGNPPVTLLRNAVIRSGYLPSFYQVNFFKSTRSHSGYMNLNLALAPREVFHELMNDFDQELNGISDPAQKNWMLAINAKRRAMFMSKYHYDRGLPQPEQEMKSLFDNAISYYRQVPEDYLAGNHDYTLVYFTDGVRNRTSTRRQLFIYPDYMEGWFSRPYHSDAFFNYLSGNNLLAEIYKTPSDLQMLHLWLSKAYEIFPTFDFTFTNNYPLGASTLTTMLDFVQAHPERASFDTNLPALVVANLMFDKGDVDMGLKYYSMIDQKTMRGSSDQYEYIEKTFFLNELKKLAANLALAGKREEAVNIASQFEHNYDRTYVYMYMTDKAFKNNFDPATFIYLDSVYSNYNTIDFVTSPLDCRNELIELLSRIGGEQINQMALQIIRDLPANRKPFGVRSMIVGMAYEGNYYRAYTSIQPTFTELDELECCFEILFSACRRREASEGIKSEWVMADQFLTRFWTYTNFQPN